MANVYSDITDSSDDSVKIEFNKHNSTDEQSSPDYYYDNEQSSHSENKNKKSLKKKYEPDSDEEFLNNYKKKALTIIQENVALRPRNLTRRKKRTKKVVAANKNNDKVEANFVIPSTSTIAKNLFKISRESLISTKRSSHSKQRTPSPECLESSIDEDTDGNLADVTSINNTNIKNSNKLIKLRKLAPKNSELNIVKPKLLLTVNTDEKKAQTDYLKYSFEKTNEMNSCNNEDKNGGNNFDQGDDRNNNLGEKKDQLVIIDNNTNENEKLEDKKVELRENLLENSETDCDKTKDYMKRVIIENRKRKRNFFFNNHEEKLIEREFVKKKKNKEDKFDDNDVEHEYAKDQEDNDSLDDNTDDEDKKDQDDFKFETYLSEENSKSNFNEVYYTLWCGDIDEKNNQVKSNFFIDFEKNDLKSFNDEKIVEDYIDYDSNQKDDYVKSDIFNQADDSDKDNDSDSDDNSNDTDLLYDPDARNDYLEENDSQSFIKQNRRNNILTDVNRADENDNDFIDDDSYDFITSPQYVFDEHYIDYFIPDDMYKLDNFINSSTSDDDDESEQSDRTEVEYVDSDDEDDVSEE